MRARGVDPVDLACGATWAAIRQDIAPIAAGITTIAAAKDRVRALRAVAPFWVGRAPAWSRP